MPKSYEFHSTFSPEQLSWELKIFVRMHNSLHRKECPIYLKWKSGDEFTIRQTDISADFGSWSVSGKTNHFLFWRAAYGSGKVWSFQDPFWGVILPDGADGSVVRICTVPWTRRILAILGAGLTFAGVWVSMSSGSWEPLLIVLLCFVLLFAPMLKSGKTENNFALFALLEEKLSGPPPKEE
ncbi:MAG: hypothetical protein HFF44_01765 [Lawsonibacter sp.]|nr:hypothetical protein [Lawsonibacter sp.]